MEQRKFPRFSVELTAGYRLSGEESLHPCSIVDISREGSQVELVTERKIDSGLQIDLDIAIPALGRTLSTKVELMWVKPADEAGTNRYAVGGRFVAINQEDRRSLLDFAYEGRKSI